MKRLIEVLLAGLFGRPARRHGHGRIRPGEDSPRRQTGSTCGGFGWTDLAVSGESPARGFLSSPIVRAEQLSYEPLVLLDDALVDPESRRKPRRAMTVADGPRFSRPRMKTSPGGFPHENVAQWDYSVVMQPETSEVGDVWRMIETALARRQEAFTLSHLMWSDDGYTVKFRQGPVNIVRTTIAAGVFGDEAGLNKLLDGVRSDFRVFDPLRGGPH